MLKVKDIVPNSPASKYGLKIGDGLLSLNGQPINDLIDYHFHQAAGLVNARFTQNGQIVIKKIYKEIDCDLGLVFYLDKIIHCRNNCIFCFVHNNPKGLRPSLYVKDDDYRLSFLYGNFVTLTNISRDDLDRIIAVRLSPLYISVQATNENVRRILFGKEKLPPILPVLEKLAASGIYFHSQAVVVPGFNDGEILDQTAADLASFRPYAASMAIVPVGLTRYSKTISESGAAIKSVNARLARALIDRANHYRNTYGSKDNRFAYAADELFIMADCDIPPRSYYDDYPQIENGVGLVRQFLDSIPRRISLSKKRALAEYGVWITGESMMKIWRKHIFPHYDFSLNLLPVKNRLFGPNVTVTGLLSGQDIIDKIRKTKIKNGPIILPPNCLNNDDKFIDDLTPAEMADELGMEIIQGTYDFRETIRLLNE